MSHTPLSTTTSSSSSAAAAVPNASPAPTMLAFANYRSNPGTGDLVVPSASSSTASPVAPFTRTSAHGSLFRANSRLSTALRHARCVACFNLYPATQRDLDMNDLLWRTAQAGEYDPIVGNILVEQNVLALAYPIPFYNFLASVSLDHLSRCMLHVLAMIADGEDSEGMLLMQQELEPSVWKRLNEYLQEMQTCAHDLSPKDPLVRDVQMLLRFCYLSPWKIEVYTSFVTPRDMSLVLTNLSPSCAPHSGNTARTSCVGRSSVEWVGTSRGVSSSSGADRPLVRSAARRPVWRTTTSSSSTRMRPGNKSLAVRLSNKRQALWRQFLTWRMYRRLLVQGCEISPMVVTEALVMSTANGTAEVALRRAETVMMCAGVEGNLLSSLPKEVVYRYIAPYVLLSG